MNKKTNPRLKRSHPRMPKNMRERLDLWKKMQQGSTKALMKLSFMRGIISKEEYKDYQRIEKERGG